MKNNLTYTRRQFLHCTALTAGALAAVPALTSAAADPAQDSDSRLPAALPAAKPPYLVFLPLGEGAEGGISPAKVFLDRKYIETLPIDGVVMMGRTVVSGKETVPYCIWSNKESITYAQVFEEAAPLRGTFSKLNRSWLFGLTTMKAGDWFGDWSTCLGNFATLARACKDLGVEGLVLNNCNDKYHPVPIWPYPNPLTNPAKTLADYRQQVRLRGQQIMEACVREYPAFKLALMIGPAYAERGDAHIGSSQETFALTSAFYSGLVAGVGEKGMVIDASVFYGAKERKLFVGSYQFRKYDIASDRYNSPSIPKEDRALWRRRLKIGYGLSYGYTEEGMTNGLKQCDYLCWYYNGANNLAPETLKEAWFPKDRFPSLGAARAAATASGVNNVASGIHFATATGEETIQVIPGDASFSHTLEHINNTGSPASITYLEKPDWVKVGADHATLSGVPPAAPRTDRLVAEVRAGGKSDTLKLTIVASATASHAENRADK